MPTNSAATRPRQATLADTLPTRTEALALAGTLEKPVLVFETAEGHEVWLLGTKHCACGRVTDARKTLCDPCSLAAEREVERALAAARNPHGLDNGELRDAPEFDREA